MVIGENMKKYVVFGLLSVMALAGCAKKQLTPQEEWQGFCKNIPSAAFNVMTDRQQGIEKNAALEHIKKIENVDAQHYLAQIIEQAYQIPIYEQLEQKEKSMEDFKKNRYEECVKQTPQ
ncbi:hypothetical protein GCM10027155_07050 [Acinetobacter apis]|uniref:Uncharacterized protein n=2 Tax=Acinetobacter apis TaxID=1229165 RepID=A0A217EE49_9GAMM|nr:hypothetical protein SAMN05444584_0714 [Acinetobacter apis]